MASARKPTQRAAAWRPAEPFNALPLLPPKIDLETRKLLKQCIPARAALAELKHAAELIPNQGVLIKRQWGQILTLDISVSIYSASVAFSNSGRMLDTKRFMSSFFAIRSPKRRTACAPAG